MSTPIKGPGGAPPGAGLPDGAEGPGPTKGPSESFRDALEGADKAGGTEGAGAAGGAEANQVEATGAVRELAADLRAGRIDISAALDKIVERAMASGPAAALGPAARRELEQFLRRQLADDPTLLALAKDLERGR